MLNAGWHCGGNPAANGTAADCGACKLCLNNIVTLQGRLIGEQQIVHFSKPGLLSGCERGPGRPDIIKTVEPALEPITPGPAMGAKPATVEGMELPPSLAQQHSQG